MSKTKQTHMKFGMTVVDGKTFFFAVCGAKQKEGAVVSDDKDKITCEECLKGLRVLEMTGGR